MDNIQFSDFVKVEIRSGTVTQAEAVPKSKKLLKLEVSFGEEVGSRTILAGIAQYFNAEGLIGSTVVAVLNLEPREMAGLTSHGMLLAGSGADGTLALVQCKGVPDGTLLG